MEFSNLVIESVSAVVNAERHGFDSTTKFSMSSVEWISDGFIYLRHVLYSESFLHTAPFRSLWSPHKTVLSIIKS